MFRDTMESQGRMWAQKPSPPSHTPKCEFFFTRSILVFQTFIQSINNQTDKWQETRRVHESGSPRHSRKGLLVTGSSLYFSGNQFLETWVAFLGPHCGSMSQKHNPISMAANFMFCLFSQSIFWVQVSLNGQIWPKCQICFQHTFWVYRGLSGRW